MKIVFVGGRQAQALCDLYRRLGGEHADWIDSALGLDASYEARLADADKLALQAQDLPFAPELETFALKAERVLFPELALDFLWPFGGQPHALNTRHPLFPSGPFPSELGDAWLNRRLAGRERPEAVEAEYLALDVASILDLDGYKRLALERQAAIDAAASTDFASRLDAEFRDRPLFANPLTPGPDLMRDLANLVFARLGAPYSLTRDWRPPSHIPELPVHPSVARHFGLAWSEARRCRLWSAEGVDFAEYVRRYLAYAEGPELEAGIAAVAVGHAEHGREALEKAALRPMGRRCASARRALASAYLHAPDADGEPAPPALAAALGRWREAEAGAVEMVHQAPRSAELRLFIAQARERLGDAKGVVEALRAALALRPGDANILSRLTQALAAIGEMSEAAASAEAEIALNPENPHARVYLASLLEAAGDGARAQEQIRLALEIIGKRPEFAQLRASLNKFRAAPAPAQG